MQIKESIKCISYCLSLFACASSRDSNSKNFNEFIDSMKLILVSKIWENLWHKIQINNIASYYDNKYWVIKNSNKSKDLSNIKLISLIISSSTPAHGRHSQKMCAYFTMINDIAIFWNIGEPTKSISKF